MLAWLMALPLLAGIDENGATVSARWLAPPQAGQEAKLAFDFKVKSGHWFYGEQKGAASKPTKLTVTAPEGFAVGKPAFPPPKEKGTEFGAQFVYEQDTQVIVPVAIPAGAKLDGATLAWKADYQFCDKETCSPRKLSGELPFAAAGPSTGANVAVQGKLPAGLPEYDFGTTTDSLWGVLLAAFLGGVLLNVMPCVLPVIAIKALSFVQHAGESRRRLLALTAAYTAGIVVVFAALATFAVLANKGWGSQFQSPAFTAAMACVIFALALSLLGVYEIPLPGFIGSAAGAADQHEGLLGSFLGGAMTTVLATPCTGPFMGSALAWSAQQSNAAFVYIVWIAIGLGMSAPYWITALFPATLKLLPKPGAWMETFKQISGFVLLATVVFLMSLGGLGQPLLTLLLGIGFACWWLGKHNTIITPTGVKWKNRVIAVLGLAAAGGLYRWQTQPHVEMLQWQPYTVAAMENALKQGKPILVDFTADWCLNCQVNKKASIDTAATRAEVERRGLVCLLADKTFDSPDIDALLAKLRGSTDISTVVVLAPAPASGGKAKGSLLTGIFTQGQMLGAIDAALGPAK